MTKTKLKDCIKEREDNNRNILCILFLPLTSTIFFLNLADKQELAIKKKLLCFEQSASLKVKNIQTIFQPYLDSFLCSILASHPALGLFGTLKPKYSN